jgi:hypothetical protein
LQKAIRMQTEAWIMEGADYILPKEKHALIHEARIRRELIL